MGNPTACSPSGGRRPDHELLRDPQSREKLASVTVARRISRWGAGRAVHCGLCARPRGGKLVDADRAAGRTGLCRRGPAPGRGRRMLGLPAGRAGRRMVRFPGGHRADGGRPCGQSHRGLRRPPGPGRRRGRRRLDRLPLLPRSRSRRRPPRIPRQPAGGPTVCSDSIWTVSGGTRASPGQPFPAGSARHWIARPSSAAARSPGRCPTPNCTAGVLSCLEAIRAGRSTRRACTPSSLASQRVPRWISSPSWSPAQPRPGPHTWPATGGRWRRCHRNCFCAAPGTG